MKKRKSIAVDMDGVIADIETQFINSYFETYGVRVSYEDIAGKPEEEAFPEKGATRKFVHMPGFFRSIPLMPGSVENIRELMNDFEIYIVSAATEFPQSLAEKLDWLKAYFPFISWRNIVLCGNKSIINTDYMIDDHCKNLDHFKGTSILFHAAHNTGIHHHERVRNWVEVVDLIKRKEGMLSQTTEPSKAQQL